MCEKCNEKLIRQFNNQLAYLNLKIETIEKLINKDKSNNEKLIDSMDFTPKTIENLK